MITDSIAHRLRLMIAISRHVLDVRIFLLLVALAYMIAYLAYPATPGNVPYEHPLGWWGWTDQGLYLRSADAFAHGDFEPVKHFYPPLYPAIGAMFLKWSSGHMFFFPDLLALLFFAYVFIRFADRYVSRWVGISLFLATTIFNYVLFQNYIIPWTSTLSTALLASGILGLIWLADLGDGVRTRISGLQVLCIALCIGLIVPTRPSDALVGGIIGLGLIIGYWQVRKRVADGVPDIGLFTALAIGGLIIGPLLFWGFNLRVFGSPLGGYIRSAGANGFFPADLLEKFVSFWLDGLTLYGEPNSGLTEHYPWLFLSLAGLIWVIIRGDILLRTVALAVISLFVVYLPYGDLLPNGLWRYLNIHYFKWTFPFLALFAVLLIKEVFTACRQNKGWALPLAILLIIPILLLSLRFTIDVMPISARISDNRVSISFSLPNKQIDFVDFRGIGGSYTEVYFGRHRLWLDGIELNQARDFRLLPMDWGARLLFIRPITGHSVEFSPDHQLISPTGPASVQLGTYHFALGALKPFRRAI